MKTLTTLCMLTAAYAVTMVAVSPSKADAADRRVGAGYCYANVDETQVMNSGLFTNLNTGGGYYSVQAFCTMPSDSYLSHAAVNTLNIHGYNGLTGSSPAKACVTDWSGLASSCGTTVSTPTGNFSTSMTGTALSAWKANPSWFPYVVVTLDAGSSLKGFWMST